jgi:hypothetical protein
MQAGILSSRITGKYSQFFRYGMLFALPLHHQFILLNIGTDNPYLEDYPCPVNQSPKSCCPD